MQDSSGFSLIEVMVGLALTSLMTAAAIGITGPAVADLRIKGDARDLANTVALAKMRAGADFTETRVYVDLGAGTYRVDTYQKTAPVGWVTIDGPTAFSTGITATTTGLLLPPPNTQAAIAEAPACLSNAGAAIAHTACAVFNSRGIPVDATGAPTGNDAFYVANSTNVYAVTVAATGFVQTWSSGILTAAWARQ